VKTGGPATQHRRTREAAIDVRLLHGFELRCGGQQIRLPLSSQRLVAFLALHNRPLLRVYVAGSLWIDASEQRSHANLRSALWRLRQTGHYVVDATPSHLSLGSGVEVDVHRVLALSRGLLRDPETAGGLDQELTGDLLPDWYDDWLEVERERLRQLRVHALEAVAEQLLAEGRFGEAVEAGLAALETDPLRESAHRLLVRVYLAEGNWGEALRQYRVFCSRLHDELGLRPSGQMEALVRPLGDAAVTLP
jgi:DNA-binding SARP family transcriptional activator